MTPNPSKYLEPSDPPAYTVINEDVKKPYFIFTCEHAGTAIPTKVDDTNFDQKMKESHIFCDHGAEALCRAIAQRLNAPAVFASYSRLIIDLNRVLTSDILIPEKSDNTIISANQDLPAWEIQARIDEIYSPYHDKITALIDQCRRDGRNPIIIPIHSYTKELGTEKRPWHLGLMWVGKTLFAGYVAQHIASGTELIVGLNQPYTLYSQDSYAAMHHGVTNQLDHLMVEVRQDVLSDKKDLLLLADHLAATFEFALKASNAHIKHKNGKTETPLIHPEQNPNNLGLFVQSPTFKNLGAFK